MSAVIRRKRFVRRRRAFGWAGLLSVAIAAGAADVALLPSVHDSGGGRSVSAAYRMDLSLGGPGGIAEAAGGGPGLRVVFRQAYAGQLDDPPLPLARTLERRPGAALKFLRSSLLEGAMDPEGDAFALEPVPAVTPAGVTLVEDGPWLLYLPGTGVADDTVSFTLKDALGNAATGILTIRVNEPAALTRNILSIEVLPGAAGTRITWVGIPGRLYRVQATESLAAPVSWVTLGAVPAGANGLYQFVDSTPATGPRFYRALTP